MLKHPLVKIIKTLNNEEIKRLNKFLLSPYFNKRRKIIEYFKIILSFKQDFDSSILTKEFIWQKANPQLAYNDDTLRSQLSKLTSLIRKFIIIEGLNSDGKGGDILEELSKRKINDLYEKSVNRITKEVETNPEIGASFFYERYRIELNKFNHNSTGQNLIKQKHVDRTAAELSDSSIFLFNFFITELLGMSLNLYFLSQNFKLDIHSNVLRKLIQSINLEEIMNSISEDNKYSYVINLYYMLHKLFNEPEKIEYYHEYKNALTNFEKILSREELSFHYTQLRNYCVIQIQTNNNKEKFSHELFDVNNTFVHKEYYRNKKTNYLTADIYRNILLRAIDQKEFQWALDFIKEETLCLLPEQQENMEAFGYANYYFAKEQYEMAIEYINKITADQFVYRIDLKNMNLKAYFILEDVEKGLQEIHSYQQYIRDTEMLSSERKNRYMNFSKFLEKLFMIREKGKEDYGFIKKKIEEAPDVSFKDWLLEQIVYLEN